MREKVDLYAEQSLTIYDKDHWDLLTALRKKGRAILSVLYESGIKGYMYGSVARGDVTSTSDLDITILESISSFKVELALESHGYKSYARYITMATPNHTPKGIIQLEPKVSISLPLLRLRSLETQFYDFAGKINLALLKESKRVPGIDKKLQLIEPIENGHIATGIGNCNIAELRNTLNVSQKIIKERIRVLKRRDDIGRTGIFLKEYIDSSTTFEAELKRLKDSNPAIRRFVSKRR